MVLTNAQAMPSLKLQLSPKTTTSPGLSWDALLKKTGVELKLLTDYDQHLFIEKGIHSSISMVVKRYATANNLLVEGYASTKPNSYLDANNLYGWVMSQVLPTVFFFGWRIARSYREPKKR